MNASGFYRVYNAGKFNGHGPDLHMFSFYSPKGQPGQCQCVEEQDYAKTLAAVVASGRKPLAA